MTQPASSEPTMSSKTREILARAQRMIPPMLDKFHKGQMGRVAVIGGSEDYTGAPYFSAMASARLGCDMSHVICTPAAGAVIKTYSPNLMVHPLMRQTPPHTHQPSADSDNHQLDYNPEHVSAAITALLPRIHVLVVGPGLGRDPLMHATVARVVRAARRRGLPLVLDADALLLVQKDPDLVKGYEEAVLTPNVVEFGRLCEALSVDADAAAESAGQGEERRETAKVEALARKLEGVTIVQKGGKDYISDGEVTLTCDVEGGKKRSGGQGDTLTGSIATFLGWRKAYMDQLWEENQQELRLDAVEMVRLAAFAGSAITKECSRLAFKKRGRSMQASDLTDEVHTSFMNLFGEVDREEGGPPKL